MLYVVVEGVVSPKMVFVGEINYNQNFSKAANSLLEQYRNYKDHGKDHNSFLILFRQFHLHRTETTIVDLGLKSSVVHLQV